MTLRLRLVLGLVVLVTAGLAVFGFATYELYSRSQYNRLDDQVRASASVVASQLARTAGVDGASDQGGGHDGGPPAHDGGGGEKPGGGHDDRPGPPTAVPLVTYAE